MIGHLKTGHRVKRHDEQVVEEKMGDVLEIETKKHELDRLSYHQQK